MTSWHCFRILFAHYGDKKMNGVSPRDRVVVQKWVFGEVKKKKKKKKKTVFFFIPHLFFFMFIYSFWQTFVTDMVISPFFWFFTHVFIRHLRHFMRQIYSTISLVNWLIWAIAIIFRFVTTNHACMHRRKWNEVACLRYHSYCFCT